MQCTCTILSSVDCLALQYFSTLSHKMQFLGGGGGGVLLNIQCMFFILSTNFV